MVYVANTTHATIYVKVWGDKELTVSRGYGADVKACGTGMSFHTTNETRYQYEENNGFTAVQSHGGLYFHPVADKGNVYLTMKSGNSFFTNGYPISKKSNVIVTFTNGDFFVKNAKKNEKWQCEDIKKHAFQENSENILKTEIIEHKKTIKNQQVTIDLIKTENSILKKQLQILQNTCQNQKQKEIAETGNPENECENAVDISSQKSQETEEYVEVNDVNEKCDEQKQNNCWFSHNVQQVTNEVQAGNLPTRGTEVVYHETDEDEHAFTIVEKRSTLRIVIHAKSDKQSKFVENLISDLEKHQNIKISHTNVYAVKPIHGTEFLSYTIQLNIVNGDWKMIKKGYRPKEVTKWELWKKKIK